MKNTKRIFFLIMIAAVCAASLACRFTGATPEAAPSATPEALVEATPAPSAPAEAKAEPGILSFENSLEALSSYRLKVNVSVVGVGEDGKPVTRRLEILKEALKAKELSHTRIAVDPKAGNAFEEFIVGRQTLIYRPEDAENPCFLFTQSDTATYEMEMAQVDRIFADVEKDSLIAAGEQVNGVLSDRYSVTGLKLLAGSLESYQAEIWLATDDGYPVRFRGEGKGSMRLSGDEIRGQITWEVNLVDVNRVDAIPLPDVCEQARQANQDIPIPPNASERDIYGGVINFSSPDEPAKIAEFYRQELPANGWTITEETTNDPLYILLISQVDRQLQVMISPDETSGSLVIISEWNP